MEATDNRKPFVWFTPYGGLLEIPFQRILVTGGAQVCASGYLYGNAFCLQIVL